MTAVFCSLLSFCMSSICLYSAGLQAQAAPRLQQTDSPVVIVIDPGHGGANEGTTENGVLEKEMNMTTALAMYEELIQYDDVQVYLTHTGDEDMKLKERAQYAAAVGADFLFSIHYNASLEHTLFGSEVWIPGTVPSFNAYGYQFGYVHQTLMRDMGLFSRGIKTRLKDDKEEDYYGIIRESAARGIPAVIIEHCHVDESRDYVYCEEEEQRKAFGRADALAVAKYFGLKSSLLGVDYSDAAKELPAVNENGYVQASLRDETPPDVCLIELVEAKPEECLLDIRVTAADYDTPLIYYSVSQDGGESYGPLQPWPESDALAGTYRDTFSLRLEVPDGTRPNVVLRAYNLFDCFAESNALPLLQTFRIPQETSGEEEGALLQESGEAPDGDEPEEDKSGMMSFMPVIANTPKESDGQAGFGSFLLICLFLVILLLFVVLVCQSLNHRKRRKRRKRRGESGSL